jgi:hypothetical protein
MYFINLGLLVGTVVADATGCLFGTVRRISIDHNSSWIVFFWISLGHLIKTHFFHLFLSYILGVQIPLGELIDNPRGSYRLYNNEYIVYDEAQIAIRYLVQFRRSNSFIFVNLIKNFSNSLFF